MTHNTRHKIIITGNNLTLDDLKQVFTQTRPVRLSLSPRARQNIIKSRQVIESALSNKKNTAIYGVNTGFGNLANVRIPEAKINLLQKNLIRSHATALGPTLPLPETRLVMLLRINTLAKGFSGVSLRLIETLINMFNKGVYPVIPQKGSVGASGDLAPLAHLALVVIGEGEAVYKGKKYPGNKALKLARIRPIELTAKEGLALINGTQVMTALLSACLIQARQLVKIADIAGAMSLETLRGTLVSFDPRIQSVRPHPGQAIVSKNFYRLLKGSQILSSHKDCPRVQDSYSIRCIPQVHGATRDALGYITGVVEKEINSATDNPLVFADGLILSGGNFHGHPIALAADFLGLVSAGLTNISERRIESLLDENTSGLPAFLTPEGGLNSGLMAAQITAASLASENKIWSHPASVDTIPTSANKEDFVSMGTTAARKCQMIMENLSYVLAIELLSASQGMEFTRLIGGSPKRRLKPGQGVETAYRTIRQKVKPLSADRTLKPDIETIRQMILPAPTQGVGSDTILDAVEKQVGRLL